MQDEFEQRIKANLDEGVANLDATTRKRLADMRHLALNAQTRNAKTARWLALSHWLPSTSLALGIFLVLFFVTQHQPQSGTESGQDQVAAVEMLNDADDFDTLSDPDFYLWADEQLAKENGHAV